MITVRLVRAVGPDRSVDGLDPAELRAWLVELRTTLAPVSVAGYVRTLRVLGNWLAAEGLAEAAALRGLRRPRVPHKVIEPVADDLLRRVLSVCSVRDRAIVLLMLDTGLRVSEVASIRLGDLRPDGTLKVRGKGSRERMVPVGSTARQAIVR
jgi:site-specific recombinase XerC